jgi:hypothetical protein
MDTEAFSSTAHIHSTGSMPSQCQHHSLHDPDYETKIQRAIDGLHSAKYSNVAKAAKAEGSYLTAWNLITYHHN